MCKCDIFFVVEQERVTVRNGDTYTYRYIFIVFIIHIYVHFVLDASEKSENDAVSE